MFNGRSLPDRVNVGDVDVHSLAGAHYEDPTAVLVYAPGLADPEFPNDYATMPEAVAVAGRFPIVARASEVFAMFAETPLEDEEAAAAADAINAAFLRRGWLGPRDGR